MKIFGKRMNRLCILSLMAFLVSGFSLNAAWSPPVSISPGPASLNPTGTPLVIDSNSVALVGWLDGSIGVDMTLSSASLFPEVDVWTTPQVIYTNTTPGLFPSFPTMSVDIFGKQTAAFGLLDGMSGSLILNASRRSSVVFPWGAPIMQTTGGSTAAGSLAIGNLGNFGALLALTATGTPPFNITLFQLPANADAWLTPIQVAVDNSAQPAVAAKTNMGMSTLAWKVNMPALQLQTMRFDFSTQEGSPIIEVPLPPGAVDIIGMDIAVDSRSDAILIYLVQFGSGNALYSSTLLSGQTEWSAPLLISDPANAVTGGIIASDASGTATILWSEETAPGQQFVRAATLPLGGSLTFVTDLTARNVPGTFVDTLRVVSDSFGNAAAVWGITIGGIPMVQVSSKAIGQNWTLPETLSVNGFFPLIALSDQGTAVVTWIDGVTNVLTGSRNLFLFALQPPSGFVGKVIRNAFLTDTAYFLKMRWTRSPAPHITSYGIYRGKKRIAVIPGTGPFTFLKHLHSKHVKGGTYSLVAIASNGNASLPVPLVIKKK